MVLDDFGYRHTDALIAMVGMNISQRFKVGYSYDFSISGLITTARRLN